MNLYVERTSISNRFSETSRSRGQRPPQHPQMRQTPSQVIVYNDFGEEHKRKPKVLDPHKYKTEVCKAHVKGACKYLDNCQFAHGIFDLRPKEFDAAYKTEHCQRYHKMGGCEFQERCLYIHDEYRIKGEPYEYLMICPTEGIVHVECVHFSDIHRMKKLDALVFNTTQTSTEKRLNPIHLPSFYSGFTVETTGDKEQIALKKQRIHRRQEVLSSPYFRPPIDLIPSVLKSQPVSQRRLASSTTVGKAVTPAAPIEAIKVTGVNPRNSSWYPSHRAASSFLLSLEVNDEASSDGVEYADLPASPPSGYTGMNATRDDNITIRPFSPTNRPKSVSLFSPLSRRDDDDGTADKWSTPRHQNNDGNGGKIEKNNQHAEDGKFCDVLQQQLRIYRP